jgi:signal transduction histidine kinase
MQNTAPAPNPLLVLLDIVASPLLLFNADGQVVFSNQAARSMRCRPALLLGNDPNVRTLVRDIAGGKIVLDHEMRVDALSDDGVARLKCRTAPKPIAGLVAMAVSLAEETSDGAPAAAPQTEQRLSLQQIMELLRAELLPPIQMVLGQTADPVLGDSVRNLHERLDRVVDLVNVFGDDVLIGDERMLMADMVHNVCEDLAPLAHSNGVAFLVEGVREDLPPVYGSARLMHRALHECVHNAVVHARGGVNASEQVVVGVRFRASGNHLLVDILNNGVLSVTAMQRHAEAIFRPTAQASAAGTEPDDSMQIGLPLAHRILQLHGGRLRIDQDSSTGLEVRLELPTGAPLRNTHHLDMLQAQIYAEDLSTLMARTRKRSNA